MGCNRIVWSITWRPAIRTLRPRRPILSGFISTRRRVPPLSPGRAERHGFDYYRQGPLSLNAAFNTEWGKFRARTVTRHTSAEFVAFLTDRVANQTKGNEIHIICDIS